MSIFLPSRANSVSVVRFLCEVRDYPRIVSPQHYIGLYEKESWQIEIGQRDFERVVGKGSLNIPPELADQQIRDVRLAVEKIERGKTSASS